MYFLPALQFSFIIYLQYSRRYLFFINLLYFVATQSYLYFHENHYIQVFLFQNIISVAGKILTNREKLYFII